MGGQPGKKEDVHTLFACCTVEQGPLRFGHVDWRRTIVQGVAHARDQGAILGRER